MQSRQLSTMLIAHPVGGITPKRDLLRRDVALDLVGPERNQLVVRCVYFPRVIKLAGCVNRFQHVRGNDAESNRVEPVSYTHLRAHETGRKLVCRLLLEKK